jgi:hypothetical protein
MSGMLNALHELNSRLSVGLAFADYGNDLGNVRVEYDKVDFKGMGQDCVRRVGIPAEAALNAYVKAFNTWNKCIGNFGCSNNSITPELHREWRDAARKISAADKGLDSLIPSGSV